ncbi:MAG TPA: hypothetical protein GXX60_03460 [Anaerolineaceae bacterium]|nr:hypothetical protein [Anaerolineaceae bacterium]
MSKRNKIIALLLMAILLAACAGGAKKRETEKEAIFEVLSSKFIEMLSKNDSTKDNDDEPDNTHEEPTVRDGDDYAINEDVNVQESVIYDDGGIKVTVLSLDFRGWMGPELRFLIENNSEKAIMLQASDLVINGYMINPIMSAEVEAGEKVNDELTVLNSDLESAGIETIQYFSFKLRVIDSADWAKTFNTDTIRIETDANPAFIQKVDDSGTVLVEQKGVRIIMKELLTEQEFWGAELLLFIENNSGQDISVTVKDVTANGLAVNPLFYADVLSGTKAFAGLGFLENDLKENDIRDIREIELYFNVIDKNNFRAVFKTDKITITFD